MIDLEITNNLINKIKNSNKIAYLNGDKNEIITYCPECESNSNKRKGHLYISLETPVFYCQKCNFRGNIKYLFEILGINLDIKYPESKSVYTKYINTESENIPDTVKYESININNDYILSKYNSKVEYIQKRLDIKDPYTAIKIPNIVYKLDTIINRNIGNISIDTIDSNYIGFLTSRKTGLILRCINDKYPRYLKYKIINNSITDYYSIKIRDIDETAPVILIGEGIFDILSVIYKNSELIEKLPISNDKLPNLLLASLHKIDINSVLYSLYLLKCTYARFIFLADTDVISTHLGKNKNIDYFSKNFENIPGIEKYYVFTTGIKKDFADL